MVKIFIDDIPFEVKEGSTVFEAAKQSGIAIPHLCYHPAFEPEGSCRMCLVEIEGMPKLELACSTRVREGMKISTRSERVVAARQGVLEFLLAEHPPDCPICDKAGECKLQDYYEDYGLFDSRMNEDKERRPKKVEIGRHLILDQERCILCTRCVRFLRQVTETQELGVFERGIHTAVDIYEGRPVDNNYSGNLAEVCPVGAITDRDFRFQTRTWFLSDGDSICPLCSRGCAVTIESHKGFSRFPVPKKVYRIKSRFDPDVNGHWICDLGRYGYGYLNGGRRTGPKDKAGKIKTWDQAVDFLAGLVKPLRYKNRTDRIAVVFHTELSNEELFLLKRLFIQDLKGARLYRADRPDGESDGRLLTAERSPNRRGAREVGIEAPEAAPETITQGTDLLLMFGTRLVETFGLSAVQAAIDGTGTSVLIAAAAHPVDESVDMVLPALWTAEKSGSLTNVDGRILRFEPAVPASEGGRAESSLLVNLGKVLGIDFGFYNRLHTPEDVYREMAKDIPFFGKHSD